MANPLLEPLIQSISPIERQQIREWLKCPLHNQRQELLDLFNLLDQKISFSQAFASLKTPFYAATTTQRLHRSRLLACIEDYLVWQKSQQTRKHNATDLDLLNVYRERGLGLHLGNRLNRQRKRSPHKRRYDIEQLQQEYLLEEFYSDQFPDRSRSLEEAFDQPELLLLKAHTAARLRQAALSLAGAQFSGRSPVLPLLHEYLQLARNKPELQQDPTITIYYHLCGHYLLEPPADLLSFPALIERIKSHLHGFPPPEQNNLLKLLLNQAIRRVNKDASDTHLKDALNLYRLGIDNQLLVQNRHVSTFTFNNIMGIALRLGEINFAANFLDNFSSYLSSRSAPEIIALNRARLSYAEGDLDSALLLLQQADYRDNIHLMNARSLLIRIYYESGEHEVLRDLIRATRALINRRKLGYHRHVYRNNLKMAQKLLNLKWGKPQAIEKFRQEVQNTQPLTERAWLLSQLDQ